MSTLGRRPAVTFAVLAYVLVLFCAHSQETNISIQNKDLARGPLYMPPDWSGGVLRVVVSGVPKDDWTIRFDYGAAGVLEMRKVNARPNIIRELPDGFEIDIPIIAGQSVKAMSSYPAMRVRVKDAITTRFEKSEQMIKNSSVTVVDPLADTREKALNSTFARVELLSTEGTLLGHCTAFRVARGYWLTAAHCAYRTADAPNNAQISRLRLQIDAYAGRVENTPAMIGKPVASGLKTKEVTSASLLGENDLDYALLEVENDMGDATIPLTRAPTPPPDTKLILLHYWKGEFGPAAGKAKSDGLACSVKIRFGIDTPSRPDLCPASIQHGCSSQGGASGGPLLDDTNLTFIALHYGAGTTGKFNCGLPAASIVKDLCERSTTVARKVTICP